MGMSSTCSGVTGPCVEVVSLLEAAVGWLIECYEKRTDHPNSSRTYLGHRHVQPFANRHQQLQLRLPRPDTEPTRALIVTRHHRRPRAPPAPAPPAPLLRGRRGRPHARRWAVVARGVRGGGRGGGVAVVVGVGALALAGLGFGPRELDAPAAGEAEGQACVRLLGGRKERR